MGDTVQVQGFLYEKLGSIGSKSERPEYFLQVLNHEKLGLMELSVVKKVPEWNPDPNLQPYVGKKVLMTGEMNGTQIKVSDIKEISNWDFGR